MAEHSVDGEDIDWFVLEQNFNGTRDSKQIRERWVNHLNPSSKYSNFFIVHVNKSMLKKNFSS